MRRTGWTRRTRSGPSLCFLGILTARTRIQLLLILLFSLISLFLLLAHQGSAPGNRYFGVLVCMAFFLGVVALCALRALCIGCLCFSTPGRVGYLLGISRLVVLCFRRFIHYTPYHSLKVAHNSTKSTRVDLHVV